MSSIGARAPERAGSCPSLWRLTWRMTVRALFDGSESRMSAMLAVPISHLGLTISLAIGTAAMIAGAVIVVSAGT